MNPFTYTRAADPQQATQASAANASAKFLAGGTNLIDLMKMGVERPTQLVDVNRLPLGQIEELPNGGGVRIGALQCEFPQIPVRFGMQIGNPPVGDVVHRMIEEGVDRLIVLPMYPQYSATTTASATDALFKALIEERRVPALRIVPPYYEHPAYLDAVVQVQGAKGTRSIAIADFHRLPGNTPNIDTNLQADELITAVDLPAIPFATRSHYLKVRDRASYAFALVSVAAALDVQNGKINAARVALGGVAHKPWRAQKAEAALVGQAAGEKTFRAAAEAELAPAKGYKHNSFKIELAKRAIVRALRTVAATG